MGKVKFKMSLKELSFEFEGDPEIGSRLHNEINKSFNAIAEAQHKLLPHDPNVIDALPSSPNGNGKAKRTSRARRPKGNSCGSLCIELRTTGYFAQKRDINAIRDELVKMGHNFKPNVISGSLLPLCKKKILKREKNEAGKFEYEAGEADVDTGNGEDAE